MSDLSAPEAIMSRVYRTEDGREFVPREDFERLRSAAWGVGQVMESPALVHGYVVVRSALDALYRAAGLEWVRGLPAFPAWERRAPNSVPLKPLPCSDCGAPPDDLCQGDPAECRATGRQG